MHPVWMGWVEMIRMEVSRDVMKWGEMISCENVT